MTDPIFFDTDCLSAFLWVGRENLVTRLYKKNVFLPFQVYDELRKANLLKKKVDTLLSNQEIQICRIEAGTSEADLYHQLTTKPEGGYKIIGRGEASAIVLTKKYDGILGSNNLRDIRPYIALYHLKHITTGEIMVEALRQKLSTEGQLNVIWREMRDHHRMLPAETFTDYLQNFHEK